jgi:hypothetical protein
MNGAIFHLPGHNPASVIALGIVNAGIQQLQYRSSSCSINPAAAVSIQQLQYLSSSCSISYFFCVNPQYI